jgi:hypothetical protein
MRRNNMICGDADDTDDRTATEWIKASIIITTTARRMRI